MCVYVCVLLAFQSLLSKANRTTADLKAWQAWLQGKLGLFATKDYLETALKDTKERLKGLSQRHYDPKRVYITFQTEQAQRRCLKAVETGEVSLPAARAAVEAACPVLGVHSAKLVASCGVSSSMAGLFCV